MPYIGNVPAEAYSQVSYQDLTGGSGTSFTLDYPVGSAGEIEVFVNNVRQEPTVAYTVSGTSLTMTGSISATDDFYVVFQGKAQQTIGIPEKQTDGTYVFPDDVTVSGNITSTGIDDNATSTAITLDSSNNLLVGTTSSDPASPGVNVTGTAIGTIGYISMTRDGAVPAFFNRKTSDGDIAQFRKDGSVVGTIGSAGSGTELYIGGSGTNTNGIYFTNSDRLAPMKNLVVSDNTQDIGHPSYRWKDIYLSGGVYLGGTGSSNLLDDYEFGTHTPVITASTTSPTYTINTNRTVYVKVGRLVSVNVDVNLNITATGSGHIYISLPFATDGSNNYHSVSGARNNTAFSLYDYEFGAYAFLSRLELMRSTGTNGVEATLTNAQVRTGSNLRICFQYIYTTT